MQIQKSNRKNWAVAPTWEVADSIKRPLEKNRYFKTIIGASVQDGNLITAESFVYTLAGANAIDISAFPESVKAAQKGLELAQRIAPELGIDVDTPPAIFVSVTKPGDPHALKSRIDLDKCVGCLKCVKVCPDGCISKERIVDLPACRGCDWCQKVCPVDAIDMAPLSNEDYRTVIDSCFKAGADFVELHLSDAKVEEIRQIFNDLADLIPPEMFCSVCVGSGLASPKTILEQCKKIYELHGPLTIIQADGLPMNSFRTSLQAIATADVILRSGIPVYVQISGGVTEITPQLARMLGVPINGIGVGIHALKIIKEFIDAPDFYERRGLIHQAVARAKELVNSLAAPEQIVDYPTSVDVSVDYPANFLGPSLHANR
jgi:Pyruvate/2-oxoacid:ferredoxin oxidoreductase delta subunit